MTSESLERFIERIKSSIEKERNNLKFNFRSYKIFCYDMKLNPSHYKSLQYFRRYIDGDLDIIFKIESKGE